MIDKKKKNKKAKKAKKANKVNKKTIRVNSIDRNKLHSATSLVNYIRSDCIVDFIDILNRNNYTIDLNDNLSIKKKNSNHQELNLEPNNLDNISIPTQIPIPTKRKRSSSFDYIVNDGNKFEQNIIIEIKNKLEEQNELENLIELDDPDILIRYNKTVNALNNRKHDIILGAILVNPVNSTYGFPDLIVTGYWIKKYIENSPENIVYDRSNYYIIDIKSSCISLIQSGELVGSGLLYDGYKAQIFVYTQALNQILNSNITQGFILGKNYQYSHCGNKIKIDDPFGKLGVIDYKYEDSNGRNFEEKINEAIKWKDYLKENYQTISLNPIKNDLLYPNMKNPYDKNFKKIKKEISIVNKEITLLWNCGIKNRILAWDQGIKNYNNKKLTPEILGFDKKSSRYNILDKMLTINRDNKNILLFDKSSNTNNWKTRFLNEFYVDFETYSKEKMYGENTYSNTNEEYLENLNLQQIYMIGVNYIKDDVNKFKCFIIKFIPNLIEITEQINKKNNLKCSAESYIFCESEKDLIIKFTDFIYSFEKKSKQLNLLKNTRLIHWSNAEPVLFKKKLLEYNLKDLKYNLPWYDLLEIFKNEQNPIIIKGCFGFGLKEIVKKLNDYKFIELVWPELDDGLLSSFKAKEIYSEDIEYLDSLDSLEPLDSLDSLDPVDKINNMINIVEYNYIDCLALYKILEWIRNFKSKY